MPSFRKAFLFWLKLGLISFGGPAGQIAIMHRELVEKRKWISEEHFLHALNFSMLLPGPEAQQLATYLGWRIHGWRGGLAAGALFVIPSALLLFALSWLYMVGGDTPWLAGIFYGLLPAVIAVILAAVLRIGGKAVGSGSLWALAAVSFVAIYFLNISFVFIILGAALCGWIGHGFFPNQFPAGKVKTVGLCKDDYGVLALPSVVKATWRRSWQVIGFCASLWLLPIIFLGIWLGWSSTPVAQGLFFSKAAMVTFGGAYAVLPYVAQQAVEGYGWLSHEQMMSGLALAETTPGPLIIVLQFVGFVGGWQSPESFSPLQAAAIGAGITTWVTFVPCFLSVFLGGPFVERLKDLPKLGAIFTAITASVVGVILNLGVDFGMHALWVEGEFDWFLAVISVLAFVGLWKFELPFPLILAGCAVLGLTSLI